jgi:hypothetical protein
MLTTGLYWCLTLGVALAPLPEKSGSIELLANDADYRAAKEVEVSIEGLLQRNPGTGKIGGRFNPYRLSGQDGDGKAFVHDLRVTSKAQLLADHVGQKVRIVGKLRPVEVDGKSIVELWPARLEPLTITLTDTPGADGIYARCFWQPAAALQLGGRQYVFRDGQQLAQALKLSGGTADQTATAQLAQRLRVPEIDWKKHMLVTVSAGLKGGEFERLTITSAKAEDDTLTIRYRLHPAAPGNPATGFGYPAETVLVNRFDGVVKIVQELAPPGKTDK